MGGGVRFALEVAGLVGLHVAGVAGALRRGLAERGLGRRTLDFEVRLLDERVGELICKGVDRGVHRGVADLRALLHHERESVHAKGEEVVDVVQPDGRLQRGRVGDVVQREAQCVVHVGNSGVEYVPLVLLRAGEAHRHRVHGGEERGRRHRARGASVGVDEVAVALGSGECLDVSGRVEEGAREHRLAEERGLGSSRRGRVTLLHVVGVLLGDLVKPIGLRVGRVDVGGIVGQRDDRGAEARDLVEVDLGLVIHSCCCCCLLGDVVSNAFDLIRECECREVLLML